MSSPALKKNKVTLELLVYFFCALLLLFSILNITSYFTPKKVLGAKVKNELSASDFWNEFLAKNPDYIPGWKEIGRYDQARNIDPNYPLE